MRPPRDRKSTRLNSSHTEIYTLSLHDALSISAGDGPVLILPHFDSTMARYLSPPGRPPPLRNAAAARSEEHTSELQSHRDLHSFPTRRSFDLGGRRSGVDLAALRFDDGAVLVTARKAAAVAECGRR